MSLTRHMFGRLMKGTDCYQVDNVERVTVVDTSRARGGTLVNPTNIMVHGAGVPGLRLTMTVGNALAAFGLGINEFSSSDVLEVYQAKLLGTTVASGSVHKKYLKPADFYASAYLDSFDVTEGGQVMAQVLMLFYSDDGTNAPYTRTADVAFPALTESRIDHGVGPFTLNGTAIPGVTGYRYQSGLTVGWQRVDGAIYAIGGHTVGFEPTITVQGADSDALEVVMGPKGVSIASTTKIELYKFVNDVLSATGKLTLTCAAGYVKPSAGSGPHGSLSTGEVMIEGSNADGSAHPFVLS